MEEDLEAIRLERFNLAASGARSMTVEELLVGVGLDRDAVATQFLQMPLDDSPNWGRGDLRDAVAALHPGASRDEVLITTGTSEALWLLFRYLRPRKVALAMPAFQSLYELPASMGAEIVPLPVRWNSAGVPRINEQEWMAALDVARPDVLLLNSPHNPSGLVLGDSLCEALLDFAQATKATVIADEHYRFCASEEHLVAPTLYRRDLRVFVTGSFIKCLGCTGLRIGWCIGNHASLVSMQSDKNYTTHTVSPLSEWIAYEVMRNLDSTVMRRIRAEWSTNRRALAEFLAQSLDFYGTAPQGGFVTCLGVRGIDTLEGVHSIARSLAAERVFMLSLDRMEAHVDRDTEESGLDRGLGFRIRLGCAPPDFREALVRMARALAGR